MTHHTPPSTALPTPPTVNASICPLCGQVNLCAMEQARLNGTPPTEPCWCTQVSFSAELLARVPEAARQQACICAACVRAASANTNEKAQP
jgi:hypothetical protein